ncbi:MAG TPA: hypothetical protein VFJ15_08595 [Oleiagrimonas sp.]|nr:hypothetical protein [Oleiagrimonas sp.]
MTHATTSEILLALRSPDAGWLGVLACAINEAGHDPQFDDRQRRLAMQLLEGESLPAAVIEAAHECATRFEAELDDAFELPEPAAERPKLTLVGQ